MTVHFIKTHSTQLEVYNGMNDEYTINIEPTLYRFRVSITSPNVLWYN